MSDWQNKSDFEINKAVAGTFDSIFIIGDGLCPHVSDEAVSVGFDNRFGVVEIDVDYCNNPSDAWAIISDNKISLEYRDHKSLKPVAKRFGSNSHNIADNNVLRAAMIVYLEMNGVKP